MEQSSRMTLRALGFLTLFGISCSSLAGNGCQSPSDADLPACVYLANSRLNHVYESLMSVYQPLLDEHEKVALKNDEREWLRSRDKQCQLDAGNFSSTEEWLHSFEKDLVKSKCVLSLTNIRLVQLQDK